MQPATKTPWTSTVVGLVLACGICLSVGCDPESTKASAPEARATSSPAAVTTPTPPPGEPEETWRALRLRELCKDWKGAYFPPDGHTLNDTPNASIPSPAIACGYRPVGWDGRRVMFQELSKEAAEESGYAYTRAFLMMTTDGKSAAQAMEALREEFDIEHAGLGELFGHPTLHFTVRGGAPLIVHPNHDMPPGHVFSRGPRLFERCAFGAGRYYPPKGHTPMDLPSARALEQPMLLCGSRPPEPLPRELPEDLARAQEAVRARLQQLVDDTSSTGEDDARTLRAEFPELEFDVITYTGPKSMNMGFRIKGGSTVNVTSFVGPLE